MGDEKLDNTVYYDPRPLRPGRHGRALSATGATERWARELADRVAAALRRAWWYEPARSTPTRWVEPDEQVQQKHWIGQTPMEAELTVDGAPCPAWRRRARLAALAVRETRVTAATPPVQPRALPHRLRRWPDGRRRADDLLAEHRDPGRRQGQLRALGAQQSRYTRGELRPMFEPGRDAGALPEILPSPDFGDRATTTATSTAAGPAARCSCRPGATTARPGRSSTSSSACGLSRHRGARGRPRLPPGQPRSRAARSGSARRARRARGAGGVAT